jgi:hypothetical protein
MEGHGDSSYLGRCGEKQAWYENQWPQFMLVRRSEGFALLNMNFLSSEHDSHKIKSKSLGIEFSG